MTRVTLQARLTAGTIARMESLRANLRIHVVALAVLLCLTLAFVSVTSRHELIAQLIFGAICLVVAGVSLAVYRKETGIADNHLVVTGIVTEVNRGGRRGGRTIKYRFVTVDRVQYAGESNWFGNIGAGSEVTVLYKPLDPTVNLPLKQFLFYSFGSRDS
jgi:hypothetical protein